MKIADINSNKLSEGLGRCPSLSSQPAKPSVPVFHGSIDNSSAPMQQYHFSVCSEWSVVQEKSEAATC